MTDETAGVFRLSRIDPNLATLAHAYQTRAREAEWIGHDPHEEHVEPSGRRYEVITGRGKPATFLHIQAARDYLEIEDLAQSPANVTLHVLGSYSVEGKYKYFQKVLGAPNRIVPDRFIQFFENAVDTVPSLSTATQDKFGELAAQWREETRGLSSLERVYMNAAYQKIIGMGSVALPMIFRELRERSGRWFWALTAITGDDPAKGTVRMSDARRAWLGWAVERGYLESAS